MSRREDKGTKRWVFDEGLVNIGEADIAASMEVRREDTFGESVCSMRIVSRVASKEGSAENRVCVSTLGRRLFRI